MATAKKKKIVVKTRNVGSTDSNGFVSVRGSFNPVWKPEIGQSLTFIPTGIHAGKLMKGQDESWLIDGKVVESMGKFVSGGKLMQLQKGAKCAVGVSAAFIETKKSFGHRLVKEGGKPTALLTYCMTNDEPIRIEFVEKKKNGRNTFKNFDIAVRQAVIEALD